MNQSDLRVMRSKKLIKDAFIDLMEEKGYKNITIKAISKRAMINRKTFYNHYDSIDTLFADILQTTIEHLLEDLKYENPNDYPNSSDKLYSETKVFLHNLSNNRRLLNILFNDVSSHELTKQLSEQLLQKIFEKVAVPYLYKVAPAIPIELLRSSITAVFITVMKWYIENSGTYSEDDVAEIFMELISKALLQFVNKKG